MCTPVRCNTTRRAPATTEGYARNTCTGTYKKAGECASPSPIAGCEVQLTANSSIDEQSSRQGRVACYTPVLRRSTVVQSDGSKVATAVTANAVDQTVEPLAVTARPSASGSPRTIARSLRIEDKSWYSDPIHGFEVCRVVTDMGPCWLRT